MIVERWYLKGYQVNSPVRRQIVGIETVTEIFYVAGCWWYLKTVDALTKLYFEHIKISKQLYSSVSEKILIWASQCLQCWDESVEVMSIFIGKLFGDFFGKILMWCQVGGNFNVFSSAINLRWKHIFEWSHSHVFLSIFMLPPNSFALLQLWLFVQIIIDRLQVYCYDNNSPLQYHFRLDHLNILGQRSILWIFGFIAHIEIYLEHYLRSDLKTIK